MTERFHETIERQQKEIELLRSTLGVVTNTLKLLMEEVDNYRARHEGKVVEDH